MSLSGARARLGDEAAVVRRVVWRLGIRPRLRRRVVHDEIVAQPSVGRVLVGVDEEQHPVWIRA